MRRKHREALEAFRSAGYDDLATYNSEVSRGLVHTTEWAEKMRETKKRFDAQMYAEAKSKGWITFGELTPDLPESQTGA